MNGPSWGKAGAVRESMFAPPSPRAANQLAPFVFEIETAGFYQYVSTDVAPVSCPPRVKVTMADLRD